MVTSHPKRSAGTFLERGRVDSLRASATRSDCGMRLRPEYPDFGPAVDARVAAAPCALFAHRWGSVPAHADEPGELTVYNPSASAPPTITWTTTACRRCGHRPTAAEVAAAGLRRMYAPNRAAAERRRFGTPGVLGAIYRGVSSIFVVVLGSLILVGIAGVMTRTISPCTITVTAINAMGGINGQHASYATCPQAWLLGGGAGP